MNKVEIASPVEALRFSRRGMLTQLASGLMLCVGGTAFAEELVRTPMVEEGPFYPTKLPLDTDNDLLIVNDSITPAIGEVTHLSGRLLNSRGNPIKNAVVEIWQVDHNGVYFQQQVLGQAKVDPNFQGYGRFLTSSNGEYYFRTVKPVRYPGRQAPHIHFKIKAKGLDPWTTQLFIKGYPGNMKDGIYRKVGDEKARTLVSVDFAPVKESRIGELAARFDIVLGFTPQG